MSLSCFNGNLIAFSHGHCQKADRELQTELDTIINGGRTLSEKSVGAGHRAVSLHRGCVLVLYTCFTFEMVYSMCKIPVVVYPVFGF